jgi:hypothetical protein
MHIVLLVLIVFFVRSGSDEDQSPDVRVFEVASTASCQSNGHALVAKADAIDGVLGATFRCEDVPEPISI